MYIRLLKLTFYFISICAFLYGIYMIENCKANLNYYKYSFALLAIQLGITAADLHEELWCKGPKDVKIKGLATLPLIAALAPSAISVYRQVSTVGSKDWKIDRGVEHTWRPEAFLSNDEYDGLVWMRKNLPKGSVITSTRKDKDGWSGNYVASGRFNCSAYTGSRFYNEGDAYNDFTVKKIAEKRWNSMQKLLISKTSNHAIKPWKNISANYIVITKRISPVPFEKEFLGQEVFQN